MKVRDEKEEEERESRTTMIPMNKIRKKPRANCKRKTRKQSTVYVPYNKAYKKPCTLQRQVKKEVKKMLSKRKKENEICRVSQYEERNI